jgi:hypothetical protein
MSEQTAAAETQQEKKPGFARRNGWVLAIAALLTVVSIATGTAWAVQHTALDQQEARIGALEGQLTVAQLRKSERAEKDLLTSLGFSRSRLDRDAPIIAALVKTAFTWGSGPAYEQARTTLKQRYSLTENDAFLKEFMPPSRYNEDAAGKRYYYIDTQGLNSSVSSAPDIEIVKAAAGDYTYTALVDVEVTSDAATQNKAGRSRIVADRRMLLTITVDADRRVSNLTGVPASGSTRHSR